MKKKIKRIEKKSEGKIVIKKIKHENYMIEKHEETFVKKQRGKRRYFV